MSVDEHLDLSRIHAAYKSAKGEWLLLSACHNLGKLHNHIGTDGLAALKTA